MATLPGTRQRKDGVFGSLSALLTAGGNTMSSVNLADLDTVTINQHAIITLDPGRQVGDPEIVMVTAHTPASTTATIQRGMYGTVAREHPAGTVWVHAAVAEDYNEILTSSTRPPDPYEGQRIYETDTDRLVSYTGAAWQQNGLFFDPPACRVFSSAAISVPDNGSANITCNQERFDTDNMHSTSVNTHLITINTAGLYSVGAGAQLTLANDYQRVLLALTVTGVGDIAYSSTRAANLAGYGEVPLLVVNTIWKFTAGQTFFAYVFQDNASGVARNIVAAAPQSPEVWACWIGRGN